MQNRVSVGVLMVFVLVGFSSAAWAEDAPRRSLLDPGRMELGVNLAGVYSSATVTPDQGDETKQKTLYLNPSLYYGLTVTENVQARLLVGYQSIETSIGDLTTQDSGTTTILVQGLYHIPFQDSFAFYAGAGMGGFFGTAERNAGGSALKFESDTSGAMFQLLLGILSQPTERFSMRAGIRLDGQFGSETPKSEELMTGDLSTQNLQMLLEFSMGVRFGNVW